MTKKEYFTILRKAIEGVEIGDVNKTELIDFIDKELELLNKRNTNRKPTAKQIENEATKNNIVATLTTLDKPVTIQEILETGNFPEVTSVQKMSALLSQLRKEEKINRIYDKKTAYFTTWGEKPPKEKMVCQRSM